MCIINLSIPSRFSFSLSLTIPNAPASSLSEGNIGVRYTSSHPSPLRDGLAACRGVSVAAWRHCCMHEPPPLPAGHLSRRSSRPPRAALSAAADLHTNSPGGNTLWYETHTQGWSSRCRLRSHRDPAVIFLARCRVRNRGGAICSSLDCSEADPRKLRAGGLDSCCLCCGVRGFAAENKPAVGNTRVLATRRRIMPLVRRWRLSYLHVLSVAAAVQRADATSTSQGYPGGGPAAAATALLESNYRVELEATIPSPLIDPHQVYTRINSPATVADAVRVDYIV